MSLLVDNLYKRLCPETVGEIILELENCDVDYQGDDLDDALVWDNTPQGHDFWWRIHKLWRRTSKEYVDIYSLKD